MDVEEVHSSPINEKVPSERHYVVQEGDYPSSYNIEEIFGAFTFNLHRKEVSWKRVMKVKKSDGILEIQEDEVLSEKIDEELVTVATAPASLTQYIAHNITVLKENILEEELKNLKLKDELIGL
jgi:hypothetical protein